MLCNPFRAMQMLNIKGNKEKQEKQNKRQKCPNSTPLRYARGNAVQGNEGRKRGKMETQELQPMRVCFFVFQCSFLVVIIVVVARLFHEKGSNHVSSSMKDCARRKAIATARARVD